MCRPWLLLACTLGLVAEPPAPPSTPKKPVQDTYHGVTVTDDYRWLEDGKDPAVRQWIDAQNHYARSVLDASPALPRIRQRLQDLLGTPQTSYSSLRQAGGQLFAIKRQPPKEQPFLVVMKSVGDADSARVLLDPVTIDPSGKTSIEFYVPSRDGKLVAVVLAQGGSEEGAVHVYEVATGTKRPDTIPRVEVIGFGDLVWDADNTGFFYTRFPRDGERPKEDLNFFPQIYHHQLGSPTANDRYEIGKEFPKIAEPALTGSDDGRWLLVTSQNGDGGEFEHFLRDPAGKWARLTRFSDGIGPGAFGAGNDHALYLYSRQGTPRGKILRLPLDAPNLARAQTVVPESSVAIDALAWIHNAHSFGASFVPVPGGLYVLDVEGGPSRLRFVRQGGGEQVVSLPRICSVEDVVPIGGDELLVRVETFTEPPAWARVSSGGTLVSRTPLAQTSPADFSHIEVVRETATSKDGTKVPLTILYRKGAPLDGNNPALLTGYGGFGISITPHFQPGRLLWLEQGGVLAVANLRGGGEFGEEWRRAGNLTHKQNVFDDFLACAQHLTERKYTRPERLAIEGGSNGGLLMGAALTQRPELFRAVVAHVGIYDMLRLERNPNGVYNVPEYGSVKDPSQFEALYAYSPYHHVKTGTAYPAVFLLCGANDPRVDPGDSRKMAAALQSATSSGRPVILQTDFGSGHGHGDNLSKQINQAADVYGFLFTQLGITYQAGHSP